MDLLTNHKKWNVLLALLYGGALLYLTFMYRSSSFYMKNASLSEYMLAMSNLVPFASIFTYVKALAAHSMNVNIPVTNLLGNLLLFMPFGYLWNQFRKSAFKDFLRWSLSVIVLLEILQLITRTGSFDIDDILQNLIGAMTAYGLSRRNMES